MTWSRSFRKKPKAAALSWNESFTYDSIRLLIVAGGWHFEIGEGDETFEALREHLAKLYPTALDWYRKLAAAPVFEANLTVIYSAENGEQK